MKSMKILDMDIKYTEEDITYDEAIKQCPKGYEMINLSTLSRIQEEVGTQDFNFWFWLENYKWNISEWRPVARGDDDYNFNLRANGNQGASRGCYVKVKI
jgi:hypothetical protein